MERLFRIKERGTDVKTEILNFDQKQWRVFAVVHEISSIYLAIYIYL